MEHNEFEEQRTILSAEELDKCEKHPCYPKDLLCLITGKSLCRICQEEKEHIRHEHVDINKSYDVIKLRINNTSCNVEKMIGEQETCQEEIKQRTKTLKMEVSEMKTKIEIYYDKLRNMIDKNEKENMDKLEEIEIDFNKEMEELSRELENLHEQSKELKKKMDTLSVDWEKGEDKPKKSGLTEEYLILDKNLNGLRKQTKKLIHETAWTSKIIIAPNLENEEESWDFSEIDILKIKIHNFILHFEDFVDKDNIQLAEEDEKRKTIMAERENNFNSYCIHDKLKYPTTTYCDECNELFCHICGIDHECGETIVIRNVTEDDKKVNHIDMIESVEEMEKSLVNLKKKNKEKRDNAIDEYIIKLNEITTCFKNERIKLYKREKEIIEILKNEFDDKQEMFDELYMSVRMWKDALDCFLEKCKSIEFDWDCEDKNNGAIYKPVRQLIQESRILCDQENDLKEKVDKLNKDCEYELDFSFKAEIAKFEEARKAVYVNVSQQPSDPTSNSIQEPDEYYVPNS